MKERLHEARELISEIEQLQNQRQQHKAFMVEYIPHFETRLENATGDDIIINYKEYDARLKNKAQELTQIVENARESIYTLKEYKLQELMHLYYIEGKTWEQVAEIMCYDVRWIYKLHNRALTALENKYSLP